MHASHARPPLGSLSRVGARCLQAHLGPVTGLAVSVDGTLCASISTDRTVKVRELLNQRQPEHLLYEAIARQNPNPGLQPLKPAAAASARASRTC